MRFLIVALLAVAASATDYGWSYGGSPSYSYYGGGYGSSLYGANYGSGIGWGSGVGYGSGSWGGSGRSYYSSYRPASYHTARQSHQQPQSIKTAYQTEYSSEEVPGSIAFTLGGSDYQPGTSGVSTHQEWKSPVAVSGHAYQQPHSAGAVYQSGYSSGGAPGNIAFTLGGTGYQTGVSGGTTSDVSGYQEWKAPVAVSRPAAVYRPQTATIRRSGSHENIVPGRISFIQDFSRISGGHTSDGATGISAFKTVAPAAVITEKHSYQQPHSTGAVYESGYSTGGAPGNIAFTLGGAGYQTGTTGVSGGYQEWKAPVAVSRPAGVLSHRTTSIRRTGVQGATAGVAPGKITFTQDFSRTVGQTGGIYRSGGTSGVSAIKKTIAPTMVVTEKHSYQQPHSTGAIYESGYSTGGAPGNIAFTLGGAGYQTGTTGVSGGYQEWKAPVAVSRPAGVLSHRTTSIRRTPVQGVTAGVAPGKITFTQDFSRTVGQTGGFQRSQGVSGGVSAFKKAAAPAVVVTEKRSHVMGSAHERGTLGAVSGQPHISFIQDFSKVTGQLGTAAIKPEIHTYDRVITPARAPVAPKIPSRSYGSSGVIRQGGFLGTSVAQPQIRYTQGVSKVVGQSQQYARKPQIVHYEKVTAPVVRPVIHQTSGHRVSGAHGFSAAGPAKISFTQDFSRVSGHQTARVQPAITTVDKSIVSGLPGVVYTDGYQSHRTSIISAPKPAPKRPVVIQEPALTTIYEQSPAKAAIVDKSVFVSPPGPVTTSGFGGDHLVDFKQEITAVDAGHGIDKQSNIYYVPGSEVSSQVHSTGDVSNKFVVIPSERYESVKPILIQSSGGNPLGGFAEEKKSVYQFNTENAGATNQNLGGHPVSTPFKVLTHLSGESPRYDFSKDRSLLYTYNSPYMVSPFSYTYSSEKGQYDQVYKKA